jgi:hypothetical protein
LDERVATPFHRATLDNKLQHFGSQVSEFGQQWKSGSDPVLMGLRSLLLCSVRGPTSTDSAGN